MFDWLIIGGGVHGTYLLRTLLGAGGVARERVRVVDPWPRLMFRWAECTGNIGMDYLRSSVVHHIDEDPLSLDRYVGAQAAAEQAFEGQYRRPKLSVFAAHSRRVIESWDLEALLVQGSAEEVVPLDDGFEVRTSKGSLQTRRVALALGGGEQTEWPEWARRVKAAGARIHHVFEPGFSLAELRPWRRLVVLGGGISALQTAKCLARRAPGTVEVLSRHPVRIFDFDTDSTWLGPRRIRSFDRLEDWDERRRVIDEARHRGSTPPGVAAGFEAARKEGAVAFSVGDVDAASFDDGSMSLRCGRKRVSADVVLLATGFAQRRPGGRLVDSVIDRFELECASCGFPVVDSDLRWGRGLFVTGPLAELELGPAARNIHGARLAGERLAAVARTSS